MITTVNNGGNSPLTFYGLSTDTKPENVELVIGNQYSVPNASFFYEMDTGDIYMYNASGEEWIKQSSGSASGSGGTTMASKIVTLTESDLVTTGTAGTRLVVSAQDSAAIDEVMEAGGLVWFVLPAINDYGCRAGRAMVYGSYTNNNVKYLVCIGTVFGSYNTAAIYYDNTTNCYTIPIEYF